jgi:hypothetical protein
MKRTPPDAKKPRQSVFRPVHLAALQKIEEPLF